MSGITLPFNRPWFGGGGSSANTPAFYPLAINGRGYIPDFSFEPYRREAFRHRSIAPLRTQADTSNVPNEATLNPEALWRRTQNSWEKGAGQRYLDRNDSDPARFYISKGIDPWTKGQLSLLSDTEVKLASANTNLKLVTVGTRLYLTDGTALRYTTSITAAGVATWTTVTGTPGAATGIATDGFNVYTAHGAGGIYKTDRSSGASAAYDATATFTNVWYVKGRLLAANTNTLSNITAAATHVTVKAHDNTDFIWVDCAEGPAYGYAAGYSGDKSLIYKLSVKSDGTGLDVPVVAGELPDGEIIRSIQGYLGFLLIGTDFGVRFCGLDSSGNVLLGDPILASSPVRCFEPQGRFVWYGLTNYDDVSSGLGRMDLRTFNDGAPAYASDIMATAQGDVVSAVTFQMLRAFAVSGVGIYAETGARVAIGTIISGKINFGIADPKVASDLHADYQYLLAGAVTGFLSQDDLAFTQVGSTTAVGSTAVDWVTNRILTDRFEYRIDLTPGTPGLVHGSGGFPTDPITNVWPPAGSGGTSGLVVADIGPVLNRVTLKANPVTATGTLMHIPIRLHEELLVGGSQVPLVPSEELAILDDLRTSGRVVIYQEGSTSYTVTIEELDWTPDRVGRKNAQLNGICTVTMKTFG